MKYLVSCLILLFVTLFVWFNYSREVTKTIEGFSDSTDQGISVAVKNQEETPKDSISDVSGESYGTVTIGKQNWMSENLRNTLSDCEGRLKMTLVNGAERGPGVKLYVDAPRYAYYENKRSNNWGAIYNHAAFMHCNLCPEGYRLPNKADWEELIKTLGGMNVAGKRMLEGGDSGFNARLLGRIDDFGSVLGGEFVFWWTTDLAPFKREREAYCAEVSSSGELKLKGQDARMGAYIRCLKVN